MFLLRKPSSRSGVYLAFGAIVKGQGNPWSFYFCNRCSAGSLVERIFSGCIKMAEQQKNTRKTGMIQNRESVNFHILFSAAKLLFTLCPVTWQIII